MKPTLLLIAGLLGACASTPTPAVGRLADVSVYDRAEQRTLPVYRHQGRYYVAGKPGNEYQVIVRNRSGGDVLGVVSVDGVNVVSGETAAPSQSGYIVASGDSLDIKGWRKNLQQVAAFYFTSHGDAYATRTGRGDNVGVIGVALFRRKPAPAVLEDRVGASAESAAAPRAAHKALGTGHGRREDSQAEYAAFERATTDPEEIVTIYYDSHANLVARGVIKAQPWSPNPFPAQSVPDPPRRG
jgi:hypothetical protein